MGRLTGWREVSACLLSSSSFNWKSNIGQFVWTRLLLLHCNWFPCHVFRVRVHANTPKIQKSSAFLRLSFIPFVRELLWFFSFSFFFFFQITIFVDFLLFHSMANKLRCESSHCFASSSTPSVVWIALKSICVRCVWVFGVRTKNVISYTCSNLSISFYERKNSFRDPYKSHAIGWERIHMHEADKWAEQVKTFAGMACSYFVFAFYSL